MAIKPDDQAIGALYREAASAEPSAELDRAILQAARAAVAAQPTPAGWRRWRLHLPVLASLVMVALLGLLISFEQPDAPSIGQIALNEAAAPAPAPANTPERATSAAPPAESRARLAEIPPPRPAAKAEAAGPDAAQASAPSAPARAASAPAANTISSAADAAPATDKSGASAPGEAIAPVEARAAARQAAAPAATPVQPAGEWLAAIQQLIDKERIEEAKTSLEAFQKAYPAATVPTAMRQRLKP
ncbi:MAG: hypothetical protein WAV95_00830 [Azonexus sp.]